MDTLSPAAHAHQQGNLQPAHHEGDVEKVSCWDSFVEWHLRTGTGNNRTGNKSEAAALGMRNCSPSHYLDLGQRPERCLNNGGWCNHFALSLQPKMMT